METVDDLKFYMEENRRLRNENDRLREEIRKLKEQKNNRLNSYGY